MALGNLIDGAGQLKSASDQLETTWYTAKSSWNDVMSARLEEESLEPMLDQVRAALDAISRLNSVLVAACRECEDRE